MGRLPPVSTRTYTLFPYTTLVLSLQSGRAPVCVHEGEERSQRDAQHQPPPSHQYVGYAEHQRGEGGQVGDEARKLLLKDRHHVYHPDDADAERHRYDRDRTERSEERLVGKKSVRMR